MPNTALILGGSGRFGSNIAEALWNAGWHVRLFDRAQDDLKDAARNVDVIVHGWNPAYHNWAAEVPGQTRDVIAAAKDSGATVLLPGNVYVYGEEAPSRFAPDTPHAAQNPLGRIRIEAERAFREADIPVILLRAGDFIDTSASGNWFDRIIAPSLAKGVLTYPGATDIPHAWAYLPDLARAAVSLLNKRAALPRFADISFPGYTLSGQDMAELAAQALERPVKIKPMAWWPIRMAKPFWPVAAGLLEMRYLWNTPHQMDAQTFDAVLPGFQSTPPVQALKSAIAPVLETAAKPHRPKQGGAGQSHRLAS